MSASQWLAESGMTPNPNGLCYRRSMVTPRQIGDGTSKTYLIGERYISADDYETGRLAGNDQGWDQGYDYDTYRWANADPYYQPIQDTRGYDSSVRFGGPHAGVFQMAMCDGSVQAIAYTIDGETHRRLGNRGDGLVIDTGGL